MEHFSRDFLATVWLLIIFDSLCGFLIGLLFSQIFKEIEKNKLAKVKCEAPKTVYSNTIPSPVEEGHSKDEPSTSNDPSKETGKEEKKEEVGETEKIVELKKKRSLEEWTPVPEDFKIDEKEMGPITIKTNAVVASDIFVVHKPEPTATIQQVQISDDILVYAVGDDVDIVEATKSVKDGSSSRGGSSIMTASIRQLEKKY